MGIVEKIKEIEKEMARTQKNKATEGHLGSLKVRPPAPRPPPGPRARRPAPDADGSGLAAEPGASPRTRWGPGH